MIEPSNEIHRMVFISSFWDSNFFQNRVNETRNFHKWRIFHRPKSVASLVVFSVGDGTHHQVHSILYKSTSLSWPYQKVQTVGLEQESIKSVYW